MTNSPRRTDPATDPVRTYSTPLIKPPGEGAHVAAMGLEHLFKLTAEESNGLLSIEEFTLQPGDLGVQPHVHERHDEHFYVLEGEITFHTGDSEVAAVAGTLVAALRGSAHGFRNATDTPARMLIMYSPGGFEGFFRDLHRAVEGGAVPSAELMADFRTRYNSWTL